MIARLHMFRNETVARLLIGIGLLIGALLLIPRFDVPDIAQDYAAAWGWLHGFDSNAPTEQLLNACCAGVIDAGNYPAMQTAHPPFATLITLPLAWLPWTAARLMWAVIAGLCIMAAWHLRRISFADCAATASFWLIALVLGTHEPVLFVLLVLACTSIDRAPLRAGMLVGVCIALKLYPALLVAGLWLSGRRRAAGVAIVTSAGAMLLAELVIGIGSTASWLRFMPINTARYVDTLENGSLVRLVREIVPGASPMIVAALLSLLLLLPLIAQLRRSDGLRPLVPVMLLVSPLSWRQYMGLVGISPLGRAEQICLAIAGVVVLLIGLDVLPGDNLAPITQIPLLITLLLLWYRMVRPAARTSQRSRSIERKPAS